MPWVLSDWASDAMEEYGLTEIGLCNRLGLELEELYDETEDDEDDEEDGYDDDEEEDDYDW